MASHPFTASERRGILIIAIISLLITGAGILVSRCHRQEPLMEKNDVEVLINASNSYSTPADSLARVRRDSLRQARRDSLKKARRDSVRMSRKAKRDPKTYRRRSPIDEPAKR